MEQYFANINDDGFVIDIRCVEKEYLDKNKDLYAGSWIETWRDGGERKNFAIIGSRYDKNKNAFIPKKPFNSWILDEVLCVWASPVPMPNDGYIHEWDEENQRWV